LPSGESREFRKLKIIEDAIENAALAIDSGAASPKRGRVLAKSSNLRNASGEISMNNEQREMLRENGYNDFIGHTVQQNGRCKCGAFEWPHRITLSDKPCFAGGGWHNFADDSICSDCGNTRSA
jgi:hypothetical protein